jgi:4-amino-4-deoxy-L-arabinose transferase-like glycosyltransferase
MDRVTIYMPARQRFRLVLLVFAISFALRAAWAAWVEVTPVSDFRGYDLMAVRWLDTGVFGGPGRYAYRTPGYPAFLALIYAVFGHSWKAAAFAQAVLGALTSGFVTALATYVLSSRGSVVAGLLHALSPTALAYVPVLASENLAVLLLIVGLLLVAIARRASGWAAGGASLTSGLLLGLLLLVRPAAIFFVPAWVGLVVWSSVRRRLVVLPPVLVMLAAMLVLSPWIVRNHRLGLGASTLSSTGGINLWMGNNDLAVTGGYIRDAQAIVPTNGLTESQADAAYRREAIAWIRGHPNRYLALSAKRLIRLMGVHPDTWAAKSLPSGITVQDRVPGESGDALARIGRIRGKLDGRLFLGAVRAVLAPLILLSLVLSFSRWRRFSLVLLPALSYMVGLSLTYVQIRFREIMNPLLFIPLAALLSDMMFGSDEVGNWLSRRGKVLAGAVLVAVTLGVHVTGLASSAYRLDQ